MSEPKDGNYPKTILALVKAAGLMESEAAKMNVLFEGIAGLVVVFYVIGAGAEAVAIAFASLFNKELTPYIGADTLLRMFFGLVISGFICLVFCTVMRVWVKKTDERKKKDLGIDQ